MDFILTHEEELDAALSAAANEQTQTAPQPGQEPAPSESDNSEGAPESAPVARSIKCDDCGKLFKTNEEVEFHASKSGN